MKKISYLVGSERFKHDPFEPFSDKVCKFLNCFSSELSKHKSIKKYPDLKSLSFWCRKKNILRFKEAEKSLNYKIGLGLAFHITPSNMPTNFAYSLIFGLLSGNSNVVKVPSKKFHQIDIICKILKKLLLKFVFLRGRITIVRYQDNEKFTSKLSNLCNARIMWGGNKTINSIRNHKIQERTVELSFADRYSFCVMNPSKIIKMSNFEINNLIQKFYNDTYAVDQNACTSPHLIVWMGKKQKELENKFWKKLYEFVLARYNFQAISPIEKFTDTCKFIISSSNIKSIKNFENYIHKIELKKLEVNNHLMRGKWGLFFEFYSKNLNNLKNIINNKYQTLTYYGISKEELKKFLVKNRLKGIDRIVPVGQSLNISLNWDGYNVINSLTRTIEVK